MFTPEQLKMLGGFIMFSLVGRLLFYRERHRSKSFKEKVKIRLVSWLWEIPVLLTFGLGGLALVSQFQLDFTRAGFIVLMLAYVGLETVKIWIYDWFNAKVGSSQTKDQDGD